MATARKIAVIFYTMICTQTEYDKSVWTEQEAARVRRFEARLKRQAAKLGYVLVPASTASPLAQA